MPTLVTRGMEIDLAHIFKNGAGVPIDPVNPTIEVVHYQGSVEVVDLAEIAMTRIKEGHYVYTWMVPNDYPEDETAFIHFRGTVGTDRSLYESTLRVVPSSSGSGSSGLIVKFTKD